MKQAIWPLSNLRLGIFGKGGSGKSTVAVLLARALAAEGYTVCLLDADSTNVGLHRALGLQEAPASLLEHYGGMVFSGGRVTCPVDDPTPLSGGELTLEHLPSKYYVRTPEGILLLTAGKIGDLGPGAGCDGPINKIARDLVLRDFGAHPVTLVDFKAGFEDSARGAIIRLDRVLVVIDPTRAAIQMAVHMQEMVRALRAGVPPATAHIEIPELAELARRLFRESRVREVHFVLNRIADEEEETYVRQRLAEHDITLMGVLRRRSVINRAWLRGEPVADPAALAEAAALADALEEAALTDSVLHPEAV